MRVLMAAALTVGFAGPAAALDCKGEDRFACLSKHTFAELKRLSLTPNEDQSLSFEAIEALSGYVANGPEATAKDWQDRNLPIYDLILALLLADKAEDAQKAAFATEDKFAFDADGNAIGGEAGFAVMKQDVASFYHGEEDMAYSRACVSDEAFRDEIGGGPEMRLGACRQPYDTRSIQRAFGMMQLLKGVSRDMAVEAVMQYAYRVPSCDVATALIDIAPTSVALGDPDTATWKVLDMATVCAAEMLTGETL